MWVFEIGRDNTPAVAPADVIIGLALFWTKGELWSYIAQYVDDDLTRFQAGLLLTFEPIGITSSSPNWSEHFHKWDSEGLKWFCETCWRAFPRRLEEPEYVSLHCKSLTWEDEVFQIRNAAIRATTDRGVEIESPPEADAENDDEFENWQSSKRHFDLRAVTARMDQEWHATPPSQLFGLCKNKHAVLARNNDELLESMILALHRWEDELKILDNLGRVWSVTSQKPRSEPEISKSLCRWLHSELKIPTNAESQPFQQKGDRLDIIAEWPISHKGEFVNIVIEVKKDDYHKRDPSMESQLLQQYLIPMNQERQGWTHGIYLVVFTSGVRGEPKSDQSFARLSDELRDEASELTQSNDPFVISAVVVDGRRTD
jgi:hypothetical protein